MKITVNTKKEKVPLQDLYGIFFEDINHAADGGLYAELVRNRSFEFCQTDHASYHGLTAWEKIESGAQAEVSVQEGDAVSPKNPHFLVMDVKMPEKGQRPAGSEEKCRNLPAAEAGVWNLGFNGGIPLKESAQYDFSCYARKQGEGNPGIRVSLRGADGTVYTEMQFSLSGQWEKKEGIFTASVTDENARLAVTVTGEGTVNLDFVSLFPKDTYKGRKNGLRRDLAEALEALHPRFLRFPGGCLVHDGTLDPQDRGSQYRWKNSIGPLTDRPARRNNWGYNQTLGLGFYEYFLLCEDIGAKPLPVLPGGYDPHHGRAAVGDALQEFIQDALDLIAFANGPADSEWGGKRAAMGHPKPFGLEYLAIGNEEVGEPFFERYPLFHKAIKDAYPDIKIIGTSGPFAAGPEYDRGWKSAREEGADFVDEHYYQSPEWFIANHHRYDSFQEDGPKVFLGEYASHGNSWFHALAEASFMTALERNAHAVGLACYAPLFCNIDYVNWKPDMIWYDNHRMMRTPNYYVQKLFMEHQGDVLLESEITKKEPDTLLCGFSDTLPGAVECRGRQSGVRFSDIVLRNEDTGEETAVPGFTLKKDEAGRFLGQMECTGYTITLKAEELEGFQGFEVTFAKQDEKNWLCWHLGGWENGDSMLGETINGCYSTLTQKTRHVEKNRTYCLEIQVRGRHVRTFVDGALELDTEVLPVLAEPLYASCTKEKGSGDVILKLVNVLEKPEKITAVLDGMKRMEGTVYVLGNCSRDAEHVLGERESVVPKEEAVSFDTGSFEWTVPPLAVCVFRLRSGIYGTHIKKG